MEMMRSKHAALMLTIVLAAACNIFEPDDHRVIYIGPEQVDCVGVGPQKCLLTRDSPSDDWQLLYHGIIGFSYEAGYEYKLLVKRRRIENPPQDASSIELRLVRVLEKKPTSTQ
jgi:hypothetical protein